MTRGSRILGNLQISGPKMPQGGNDLIIAPWRNGFMNVTRERGSSSKMFEEEMSEAF